MEFLAKFLYAMMFIRECVSFSANNLVRFFKEVTVTYDSPSLVNVKTAHVVHPIFSCARLKKANLASVLLTRHNWLQCEHELRHLSLETDKFYLALVRYLRYHTKLVHIEIARIIKVKTIVKAIDDKNLLPLYEEFVTVIPPLLSEAENRLETICSELSLANPITDNITIVPHPLWDLYPIGPNGNLSPFNEIFFDEFVIKVEAACAKSEVVSPPMLPNVTQPNTSDGPEDGEII